MQGPYATSTPLNVTDGLLPHKPVSEIVNFNFNPTYLRKVRGNFIETTNGAWAVLGGTKGVTDRNLFLIAQLTTTGSLAFRLNLQIETPIQQEAREIRGRSCARRSALPRAELRQRTSIDGSVQVKPSTLR